MRTVTIEEFAPEQLTTLADLHKDTQTKLLAGGLKELLPVQQVTHKLFIEGNEIVVK